MVADGFADFTGAEPRCCDCFAGGRGGCGSRWLAKWPGRGGQGTEESYGRRRTLRCGNLSRTGAVEIVRRRATADSSGGRRWRTCERNLFRSFHQLEPASPEAAATAARFQIVAASSVQAEIEEIPPREAAPRRWRRPGDIVVAFRSTRDEAERLRQALDDFGVPFWLDAARRLASTPLVRSLVGVLRLAGEDWPYRRRARKWRATRRWRRSAAPRCERRSSGACGRRSCRAAGGAASGKWLMGGVERRRSRSRRGVMRPWPARRSGGWPRRWTPCRKRASSRRGSPRWKSSPRNWACSGEEASARTAGAWSSLVRGWLRSRAD